jgi:hypothetical protein
MIQNCCRLEIIPLVLSPRQRCVSNTMHNALVANLLQKKKEGEECIGRFDLEVISRTSTL